MIGKSSKLVGLPLLAACAALALCIAPAVADTSKTVSGLLKAKGLGTEDLKGAEDELKVPADWVEKAKKEKGQLLYNGIDDPKLTQKYLAAFKERYPFIEVVYTRGVGAGRAVKPLIAFKSGKLIADAEGLAQPEAQVAGHSIGPATGAALLAQTKIRPVIRYILSSPWFSSHSTDHA